MPQTVRAFEAVPTAERKRKAEESVNDKLATMATAIVQLTTVQKQVAESQKSLLETIKAQAEEIKALKAIVQEGLRQRSYSEIASNSSTVSNFSAISNSSTMSSTTASPTKSTSASSTQGRREKPQLQDERAVSIDIGKFKGARNNYNGIRDGLRDGLKINKVTEGLSITCLRPGPGDRVDVVFANKDEATKAKQHTRWLTSSLTGARVKGEQWYPVKYDSVVKQCVLDGKRNDGKALKKDFLKDFKADNESAEVDGTAMKATWLSKADATKKVGSLVVWLKNKVDADYLLSTGMVMFGATDAFCSPFVIRDISGPCYNCNRHGHKQGSCTSQIRCAICSRGLACLFDQ